MVLVYTEVHLRETAISCRLFFIGIIGFACFSIGFFCAGASAASSRINRLAIAFFKIVAALREN
jgi:hypothetical protein